MSNFAMKSDIFLQKNNLKYNLNRMNISENEDNEHESPFGRMKQIVTINSDKFEQLFTDHYDSLYRYCQTMIKDQIETEDIVQSVFMDLWNDRKKLVIHTSIKAFLYKAVYFKCMNKIKHDKVASKYTNSISESDQTMTVDTMILQEISDKITQTLDRLPDQCRKIFSMSRYDGLRYNEIAEILKLSPKTIENQMGKALKTMRVALSEYIQVIVLTILTYLS